MYPGGERLSFAFPRAFKERQYHLCCNNFVTPGKLLQYRRRSSSLARGAQALSTTELYLLTHIHKDAFKILTEHRTMLLSDGELPE